LTGQIHEHLSYESPGHNPIHIIGIAIVPEERYLRAKFGAEYEEYTHRVHRWL